MLSSYIYATVLALATFSVAAPANLTSTNPLPLAPIRWHGRVEKDGPIITIEGQHHEVIQKIKSHNPWWQRENASHLIFNSTHHHAHFNFSLAEHALDKRSNRIDQHCMNPGWPNAFPTHQQQNMGYITQHYGDGMCEALPRSCGRFACCYNSALLMCNDANTPAIIPCWLLHQNTMFVYDNCVSARGVAFPFNGQAFYINPSYNVILKGTDPGRHC